MTGGDFLLGGGDRDSAFRGADLREIHQRLSTVGPGTRAIRFPENAVHVAGLLPFLALSCEDL